MISAFNFSWHFPVLCNDEGFKDPFFKSTNIRAWSGISRRAVVLRTVRGSHRGQNLLNDLNYFLNSKRNMQIFQMASKHQCKWQINMQLKIMLLSKKYFKLQLDSILKMQTNSQSKKKSLTFYSLTHFSSTDLQVFLLKFLSISGYRSRVRRFSVDKRKELSDEISKLLHQARGTQLTIHFCSTGPWFRL